MPVLKGSVTFSRFRVELKPEASKDNKRWLPKGLKSRAFEPLDPKQDEDRAAGFVELENADSSEFSPGALYQGTYALFALRIDKFLVPSSALKAEVERWAQAFTQEQGRPPARREKSEMKETLRRQLRARTVPSSKLFDVSWNQALDEIQIWAGSRKLVEEIQLQLEDVLPLKLVPLGAAARAELAESEGQILAPTPELASQEALHVA